MDAQNTTDKEIQPPAEPAQELAQRRMRGYLHMAALDAEKAAFEALPFIPARKPGEFRQTYWLPERLREVSLDEQSKAYAMGILYARMLSAHCQRYKSYGFEINRITQAVAEAGLKHPRKGSHLRSGFLDCLAEFTLAGMRASRSH